MPSLPIISGKKLLKLLLKHDFISVRQKGSHVFIENKEKNLRTVVPVHSNEDLGRGLLKKILDDLEIGVEEFVKWLH